MAAQTPGSGLGKIALFLSLDAETAMSLFKRPDYVSETTQFLDQLKAQRPDLEAEQRQGRALLWEQSVDHNWNASAEQARVKQKPYVYQSAPSLS